VGHSQHNGLLAAEKRCRDEKNYGGSQKGQNETIEFERTGGSRNDENVSNAKRQRLEGHVEHGSTIDRKNERTQFGSTDSSRSTKDVPNTNTRLSIGENEEVQTRGETINSSSSRGSEDVSDTNKSLRGRGRTIPLGGENKVWGFRVKEEGIRDNVRIETIRRNAVSGEEEIILQSNNERQQESNTSKESEGQTLDNRRYDKYERDATDTNEQRTQVSTEGGHTGIEMSGSSSQKTWWQIESDLCGVPNGISYELDKDRANRIKTLGNAIVPQIAREFGLAIKKVLSDS
jgi:hypothetical protein